MKEMKDVLRRLRSERDEKQSTIADALLLSRGTYSSYENGITPPTEVCIKLARYFDVTLEYLLGISNERKPVSGDLAPAFAALAQRAGEAALTASDVKALLDAANRYYLKSAPCGDTPLLALRGFMDGLRAAMEAAEKNDFPAVVDAANAAVVSALSVSGMPAKLCAQSKEP